MVFDEIQKAALKYLLRDAEIQTLNLMEIAHRQFLATLRLVDSMNPRLVATEEMASTIIIKRTQMACNLFAYIYDLSPNIWYFDRSIFFTLDELGKMKGITGSELLDILLECSHVCAGGDGVYAVAASGKELGGVDCEASDHDEYGLLFPCDLFKDMSIQEGLKELHEKKDKKSHPVHVGWEPWPELPEPFNPVLPKPSDKAPQANPNEKTQANSDEKLNPPTTWRPSYPGEPDVGTPPF